MPPGVAPAPAADRSTWAPLRMRTYRLVWFAQMAALTGTWMHMVGAQWLLVQQSDSAFLVALVQAATALPMVVLALPAGVLADVVDRRRLLVCALAGQATVAVTLTLVTWADQATAVLLLSLTFLLAAGAALALPAWQSLLFDLVPRDAIPAVAALNGVNANIARAVGPAVAGLLISASGAEWVFAANALSFSLVVAVLVRLRPGPIPETSQVPEALLSALWAGTRYLRHSAVVRRALLRTGLFIFPAVGLWALLPVLATGALQLGATGYGVLLSVLGAGAIAGAFLRRPLEERLAQETLLGCATATYTGFSMVVALTDQPLLAGSALFVTGGAWLVAFAVLSGVIQLALPSWVRARGVSGYLLVVMLGQAAGSAVWGGVADKTGVQAALMAAAGTLALVGVLALRLPLIADAPDTSPSQHWPEPQLSFVPAPDDGPVLVTSVYSVAPEQAAAFIAAMRDVERSRRRTGATWWVLSQDGADRERFVEIYSVASWGEHLRQHSGRATMADRAAEDRAKSFTDGRGVVATHLFSCGMQPVPRGIQEPSF
ncbi:MAG: MFS transporter [Mycobacteriales bacterium]